MRNRTLLAITLVAVCCIISGPTVGQTPERQRRDPVPSQVPESASPERDIFVPLWTEPIGPEHGLPPNVRRQRADFVWTGVPLESRRVEATDHPKGATALLLTIRPLSVREPGVTRSWLEIIVRVDRPLSPSSRPFLEVVDNVTLLQSRGWGRLVRRTPEGAEWLFRLPDPLPPPPGQPNPISARVLRTPDPGRRLELRLVSEAPAPP
jgi:hypothetical protein